MTKKIKESNAQEIVDIIKEITIDIITLLNPPIGLATKATTKGIRALERYISDKEEIKKLEQFIIDDIKKYIKTNYDFDDNCTNVFLKMASTLISEEIKEEYLDIRNHKDYQEELIERIKNIFPEMGEKSQTTLLDIVSYQIDIIRIQVIRDQELKNIYFASENNKRKRENEENAKEISLTKAEIDELRNNQGKVIPPNQMLGVIEKERDYYAKKYEEPLYLHRDNPKMNLDQLFVFPTVKRYQSLEDSRSVEQIICNSDNKPLILLGDGGSGKSTIVSWISWIYKNKQSDYYDSIFTDKEGNERELIVVRLREIDREICQTKSLFESICSYLSIDKDDRGFFVNKYVVLDGFDELFLSVGVTNWYDKLKGLLEEEAIENCNRLIITSRPTKTFYGITNCNIYLIIKYSDKQKQEWIKKFNEVVDDEGKIDKDIEDYILNDDEVFFYPQLMYLASGLKHSNKSDWSLDNKWSLYHQVFWEEVYRKRSDGNRFLIEQSCRDTLYKLTSLIAYDMFKNGFETCFYNFNNELNELINENLTLKEKSKLTNHIDQLENMVTFCCFFDNKRNGIIEFLHNNIRDYFISEYIYEHLKEIVCKKGVEEQLKDFINIENEKELYNLLRCIPIKKEVLEFLNLRVNYESKNEHLIVNNITEDYQGIRDFVEKNTYIIKENTNGIDVFHKKTNEGLWNIFIKCASRFDIYSDFIFSNIYDADGNLTNRYIAPIFDLDKKISIFLINVYNVFRQFVNIKKDYWISLVPLSSEGLNFYKSMIYPLSEKDSEILIDFRNTVFYDCVFKNVSICGALFDDALFYRCMLNNVDFKNNSLIRTEFNQSRLANIDAFETSFVETKFNDCRIIRVDFSKSKLNKAYFYKGSIFNSIFTSLDLRGVKFQEAKIIKGDFLNALLENNDLKKADFNDSILSNARLNDAIMVGINLMNARLSRTHMNNANLYDARLVETNLTDADLEGANLQKANLSRSNLTRVNLKNADLREANLTNIKIYNKTIDVNKEKDILLLVDCLKESINWREARYTSNFKHNKKIINMIEEKMKKMEIINNQPKGSYDEYL